MPKQGQRQPVEVSARRTERKQEVAAGGKTRAGKPRSGRSGSDSNKEKKS
jgi:hypothetical protein